MLLDKKNKRGSHHVQVGGLMEILLGFLPTNNHTGVNDLE